MNMEQETTKRTHTYIRIAEVVVGFLAVALVAFLVVRGGNTGSVTFTRDSAGSATSDNFAPVTKPEPPKEVFVVADVGKVDGSAKENIATVDPSIFKAPESFKTFSYDANIGKKIAISGTCRDSYYALLIFDSKTDYRKEPAAARYNSAFPCNASHLFTMEVNVKDFNLATGNYYLFIADKGEEGSWYNPR